MYWMGTCEGTWSEVQVLQRGSLWGLQRQLTQDLWFISRSRQPPPNQVLGPPEIPTRVRRHRFRRAREPFESPGSTSLRGAKIPSPRSTGRRRRPRSSPGSTGSRWRTSRAATRFRCRRQAWGVLGSLGQGGLRTTGLTARTKFKEISEIQLEFCVLNLPGAKTFLQLWHFVDRHFDCSSCSTFLH